MICKIEIDKMISDEYNNFEKFVKKCVRKGKFRNNQINMSDNLFILSELYFDIDNKNKKSKFDNIEKLKSYCYQYIYNQFNFPRSKVNYKSKKDKTTTRIEDIDINDDTLFFLSIDDDNYNIDDDTLRKMELIQIYRNHSYINDKLFQFYFIDGDSQYKDIKNRLKYTSDKIIKNEVDKMRYIITEMIKHNDSDIDKIEKIYDKVCRDRGRK